MNLSIEISGIASFTDDLGTVVLDITVDYLHGFGLKPDGKKDKNLPPFRSGGVTFGEGEVDSSKHVSKDTVKQEGYIEVHTSLDYNYSEFGSSYSSLFGSDKNSPNTDPDDTYNVVDSDLSDWVFEVIYKIKVPGEVFGTNSFGGVTVPLVHHSPSKIGKNEVSPQNYESIPQPVPEPSTILLVSSGFLGLLGIGIRRGRKQAMQDR